MNPRYKNDLQVVKGARQAGWLFGNPVLVAGGAGRVNWSKGEQVISSHQKGTGWLAELYGGAQSGDDWAACYIPVNELPLDQLESAYWSWYQTATETMGVNMVIWVHDPTDFDKRAEITQLANISGLDKAAGWNSHELVTTTDQFFYYGENTTGCDLTAAPPNYYGLNDFQGDDTLGTWSIYRISFEFGWDASGTYEAAYLAEVKINGMYLQIRPDATEMTQCKSPATFTSDTAVKAAPGKVFWITISDLSADGLVQINDSTADGGTDVWQLEFKQNGMFHAVFDPPIECRTGIFVDVPTGSPTVAIGYL